MKKFISLLLPLALIFAFTGCGSPEDEQPEEQIDYEIAMVTDASLIMDGGYSEIAWDAISSFGSSKGVSHKYYKAAEATEKSYQATIDNAVSKGAKVIIADGSSFADVVYNAQEKYQDVKFILIDAEPVDADSGETKIGGNTMTILFASEQAGYLAGYGAVKEGMTELGFIGGVRQPVTMDYGYGFLQGAEAAAQEEDVTVNVRYHYCTNDEDWEEIQKEASSWYKTGTEVIFACGQQVEQPVIEAAELLDRKVIASETDKSQMSDTVITSAVKEIGTALEDVLKQYKSDAFPGGSAVEYNAENDGIRLEMENSRLNSLSKSDYNKTFNALADGDVIVKRHDEGRINALGLDRVHVTEE